MNQYSRRRERLAKAFKSNTAILIFSGNELMFSEDEAYPFRVNRNFYYLTGIDAQGMALLIYNCNGVRKETLFILPYDAKLARWVGGRMLPKQCFQISEIKDIKNIADLNESVEKIYNENRKDNTFKFYLDLWRYKVDQNDSEATKYARKLKDAYPGLLIKDIYPILTSMRLVKDEFEINEIKKAIHITNLGIQQMMRTARPGTNELTLEGIFEFVLKKAMCKETSFKTIVASGPRGTILHYSDNDQEMQNNELVLCDLGATSKHYCADITRTFPVNGRFTPRQREIYRIVLTAQKIVESNARVGMKLKDLNQLVIDFYRAELPKHGLTKDVSEYYFHNVSHHLGLDDHDVNGGIGDTLTAGNVISNEPGLYIADEGIGIRIEDDLLITGTGAVVLSSEIIKSINDIENFMGQQ